MAINDISLTAGMRNNLVSLQGTVDLLNRTQTRLSSGKKVNTALDNPVSFFTAKAHMSRAGDLAGLKDAMGEAVQTIKTADKGITSITSLIDQAKALGQAARGASKNQIKVQFSGITSTEEVVIGGDTYTAALSVGEAGYDAATYFIVTEDVQTSVANLAALINANKETSDMKAIASGSTLILESKTSTAAVTELNYADYVDVSAVTTKVATFLTDTDGYHVFSDRRALGEQYNAIIEQIDAIATSSGYKGTNILMNEDLNVMFEGSALSPTSALI